jgi:hypothetical protein
VGFFDFLSGSKAKPSKKTKIRVQQATAPTETAPDISANLSPETLALLSAAAAAYVILEGGSDFSTFRIVRVSDSWAMAGRQQLMDARSG